MATIAECLGAAGRLQTTSDTPRLDVELLLAECLEKDRTYLFTWPEKTLSAAQQTVFEKLLARREKGEPIAHILGVREFWSLPLQVNASTLIPRPDTELLVELVLALLPDKPQRVLDLGTGTGAIALALASERPDCNFVATDKSPAAVALAETNRKNLNLDNVTVLQSDWFAGISPIDFDVIVSNPPYIDADDKHLHQGDVQFEPLSALVAGEQGLADIRHIVQNTAALNQRFCQLLLEHGWQQAQPVRQLMIEADYTDVKTHCDLAGRERVTLGAVSGKL